MKRLLTILIAFPLLAGFTALTTPTDKGNEAYNAGKYDDALDMYQKAADDNPDKAEAHYNLGSAYYKKGEFDKALKEYGEAVRLDPKMADAYYNAGDSLYRLGKYEEALDAFKKEEALTKKDPDTVHNIVLVLKKIKAEQKQKQKQGGQPQGRQGQGRDKNSQGGQSQPSGGRDPAQQSGQAGQREGPRMSNEEVQAMLDRQKKEEKSLRNYFRPGKKQMPDRQAQIEQMLRGTGGAAPSGRQARPGAPYVEKDW